jgi:hypothetical protein
LTGLGTLSLPPRVVVRARPCAAESDCVNHHSQITRKPAQPPQRTRRRRGAPWHAPWGRQAASSRRPRAAGRGLGHGRRQGPAGRLRHLLRRRDAAWLRRLRAAAWRCSRRAPAARAARAPRARQEGGESARERGCEASAH